MLPALGDREESELVDGSESNFGGSTSPSNIDYMKIYDDITRRPWE